MKTAQFLKEMFGLEGKTAVVIGGTGELCSNMALGLANAGAEVVLVGRNEEKANARLKVIEEAGGRGNYAAADAGMEKKDVCGNGNCGTQIYLHNSNEDRGIRVSLEATWKIGGNYDGQLTEYEILPGAELLVGCSHYCRKEGNIAVKRKILGAEYM